MGRHKDGRLEPRSKAQHDRPTFEKYKKARQDLHPRFSHEEQGSSRRPSRATRGAPQYKESGDGDSSPSSNDDETEDYRVEHRKRKSTDIESDDDDVLMMSSRLRRRRRHLQFSTHLREDCQLTTSTMVCVDGH
jgi:hypothetical protein